jgi:hypothetical protein
MLIEKKSYGALEHLWLAFFLNSFAPLFPLSSEPSSSSSSS